jgi:hypothetical protein
MKTLDKFEQLASDSTLTAVILGNPALTDFELIAPAPLPPETQAKFHARNFGFIGVVGVVEGRFRTALAVPLDDATAEALAAAFVQYVVAKLNTKDVTWFENLWALPDSREN